MNAHLQAMNGIADIAGVLLSENMFGADEGGETESVAEAMAAAEKNKRERQAFEDGRKAVKQYGEAADRKRVNRAKASGKLPALPLSLCLSDCVVVRSTQGQDPQNAARQQSPHGRRGGGC